MINFIVLGIIPGTQIQLSLNGVLNIVLSMVLCGMILSNLGVIKFGKKTADQPARKNKQTA